VNLCTACGLDFPSVEAFDRHRVGVHAYSFAEGLAMEPPREDGRRCLDEAELRVMGWAIDKRGRWYDPARSARLGQWHEGISAAGMRRRRPAEGVARGK
jgi:hypothetical protein